MRILWAPWRIKYILSPKKRKCFLCEAAKSNNDEENLVVFRGYTCFVILNIYALPTRSEFLCIWRSNIEPTG